MRLSTLLKDFISIPQAIDCDITGVSLDSRLIKKDNLFIAIQGTHSNGHQYINDAIAHGACAILMSSPDTFPNTERSSSIAMEKSIPMISIPQLTNKIGQIAARFYHHPAEKLCMIGATGTNGKTSCTHFIAQLLQAFNVTCGVIGTLGQGFYGRLTETGLTTPDAVKLQAILRGLLDQGAQAVAMEVSSHSIAQARVNNIPFEIGIFTNLTQDHLDYHGDMQTYAAVKRCFLAALSTQHLIINADDSYGAAWLQELADKKPIIAYSVSPTASSLACIPSTIPIVYADNIQSSLEGIHAYLHSPWGEGKLFLPLMGQFNLSNALAALTVLCVYGMRFDLVLAQLAHLHPVPGRMQLLGGGNKQPVVLVDYAHTPDALEKVLQAIRAHLTQRLICVFGCGGDRDASKRPLMAKIAETYADDVIVTNDNPRHESPDAIAAQIMQGFERPERVKIILDRAQAIAASIQLASVNDCVLIAGKGAERYQQIGDKKIPFEDVEQVLHYLNLYFIH